LYSKTEEDRQKWFNALSTVFSFYFFFFFSPSFSHQAVNRVKVMRDTQKSSSASLLKNYDIYEKKEGGLQLQFKALFGKTWKSVYVVMKGGVVLLYDKKVTSFLAP